MDADDIVKQGKELAEKLRHGAGEQVAQNEKKIKDTIGRFAGFLNSKTRAGTPIRWARPPVS